MPADPSVQHPNLAIPTVHLNGTGADDLLREARDAVIAIQTAIAALSAMTVHGRDYYVQDRDNSGTPLSVAMAEHRARLVLLQDVQHELERYWQGIYAQVAPVVSPDATPEQKKRFDDAAEDVASFAAECAAERRMGA